MSGIIKPSDPRNTTAAQASYQPQDRIQVQPGMPFNPYAGQGQVLYPQAFPAAAGRRKRQGWWRDHGILLGLWLLVLLIAVVIGERILDPSAGAAGPGFSARATPAPADRASPAAFAASRLAADDDPFDDLLPALPSAAAPAKIPAPAETAAAAASLRASTDMAAARVQQPATVAGALALVPDASVRRLAPPPARMPAACSLALSAMQLCDEAGK